MARPGAFQRGLAPFHRVRTSGWRRVAIAPPLQVVCAGILVAGFASGADLAALASLDGASGDEGRVIEFIASRVEQPQRRGANGSLVVEFGEGDPRALLVTGVDEPGYAVTGITEEGYLQVAPLANSLLNMGLADYFRGQHVNVSTADGGLVPGVVAAPSVHFAGREAGRYGQREPELFVDIGAASRGQARAAGVRTLDRVTLEKRTALVGPDSLASPWASTRVGASVLLELARRMQREPPDGTVVLAFVTQQHPGNAGLARAVRSIEADRVVVIAPHGERAPGLAAVAGMDAGLVRELMRFADASVPRLRRAIDRRFAFGPFADPEIWAPDQRVAVLTPGVRNAATPAETVQVSEVTALADLLGAWMGLPQEPKAVEPESAIQGPEPSQNRKRSRRSDGALERMLRQLVAIQGVSGREDRVRDAVRNLLPADLAASSRTDAKGNLIVRLGSDRPPSAVFLAHMDEIGFTVQSVTAAGSIVANSVGGGTSSLFAWQPASIHAADRSVPAVMTRAGSLEVGTASGEQVRDLGIQAGNSVTVPKRYRRLLNNRVSARSLDDRLGCAVLVEASLRLQERARGLSNSVEFVFTVEEEIGLRGARHMAADSAPPKVYAVDTFVTSDSPLESRRIAYAKLGSGPVLRALDQSGAMPNREVARIVELAERREIPLQLGVTAGGNDGAAFVSLDTAVIPIGFPLRYAHTPVETADLDDAEVAVDLVVALALEALRPN